MTACLARLAAHVTSIDIYEDFVESARDKLSDIDIENVDIMQMDATQELPDGRFDVVALTGSIERFDPRYVEALNDHGRLFVVTGNAPAMEAKLIERTDEHDWQTISLFETELKPLVHGALPPQFSF